MASIHDAPTGGHPGRDKTIRQTNRDFWWPAMNKWIADYMQGCAECQQAKNLTHKHRAPMYRISTPENAKPFQQIAMDLITGLPLNRPYDSILTIVDHGCSRAALFLPCAATIMGPDITQLSLDNIYRWFGLPLKMISNHDPCFTSHFGRALTAKLGIEQNLSMAFHPQTNGLAEWTNQWIEQYLRLVTGLQPNDWARWLMIAMAVHNDRINTTLNMSPNEALLEYHPIIYPNQVISMNNEAMEVRLDQMVRRCAQATAAINQALKHPDIPEDQFREGQYVWLEAANLKLPYQSSKLAPK
jgi:Integrase zinc binding domain